jgi:hypothetical protein
MRGERENRGAGRAAEGGVGEPGPVGRREGEEADETNYGVAGSTGQEDAQAEGDDRGDRSDRPPHGGRRLAGRTLVQVDPDAG